MTPAEEIKQNQDAAMLVIKRVAESLPGFTFGTDECMLDGEAETPGAGNAERPLTPNRPS